MIPAAANPEIGRSIVAGSITTNYHEQGLGPPVLLIHGSGPGVSAWANWRLNIGALAQRSRVIAPDLVGFGYTERPEGITYGKELWVTHMLEIMNALAIDQADIVGNSMGGGLAIAFALQHPERVRRLVLMGSVGVSFPITPGLDAVWGYKPSIGAMRGLLDIFAHDRALVSDGLAELRYEASIKPGFQESFSSMFPVPRQNGVDALATDEIAISSLRHACLIIHGREDRVIPPDTARRLFNLIPDAELHMFGHCGHWTQIERVERFNDLVSQFLHQ